MNDLQLALSTNSSRIDLKNAPVTSRIHYWTPKQYAKTGANIAFIRHKYPDQTQWLDKHGVLMIGGKLSRKLKTATKHTTKKA